eukprot:8782828-Alexandrium_andersonii.AAC.1
MIASLRQGSEPRRPPFLELLRPTACSGEVCSPRPASLDGALDGQAARAANFLPGRTAPACQGARREGP